MTVALIHCALAQPMCQMSRLTDTVAFSQITARRAIGWRLWIERWPVTSISRIIPATEISKFCKFDNNELEIE